MSESSIEPTKFRSHLTSEVVSGKMAERLIDGSLTEAELAQTEKILASFYDNLPADWGSGKNDALKKIKACYDTWVKRFGQAPRAESSNKITPPGGVPTR